MKGIKYPLYRQCKALRDLSDSNSLWVTAMYVGILVAVISLSLIHI